MSKVKVIKKKVKWVITECYLTATADYVCQSCFDHAKDLEMLTTHPQRQNIAALADSSASCFQSSLSSTSRETDNRSLFSSEQNISIDDRDKVLLNFKLAEIYI